MSSSPRKTVRVGVRLESGAVRHVVRVLDAPKHLEDGGYVEVASYAARSSWRTRSGTGLDGRVAQVATDLRQRASVAVPS